jgi:ATP-dependent helicase/nuclease subunit B
MVSFLDKVIKDIINKYKNFNNLVLILPNLSSKEKINNIIKNKFNVNDFCIPKIYLFKDLMIKISNLKIVENFTLWIKIYNIFYKKKSFKNFIKSYSKIINYFNILDLNLVDISIFFSLIKSIENTEFFLNKKKKIFFTWKEISKYYFDIKKFLLKNKIGYIGLVYKTAVSYLNKFLHKNYNIKKFIFIGINYLNISEKEIINKLIKYKKAEIYYDLDNYYYNDFKQEANLFIKEHHKNWKKIEGKSFKWIENNFIKKKNIQIIGTSCMITQIKIIGELLYNIFSKKKNIGIIIKDEKIINPIINSIPNNIKEFNITSNYLIENINLSNTFSKIFKLFSKKKFFKKKKFLYSNVYEFFFDGYIKSIFNLEIKECNFLHFLLKKKKSYISYNEIKNKLLNKNLLSILDIENKNNKIYINIIINFCKKIQIFFLKKKKKFFLELKFLFFFKKWLNTLKKYHFFYKKENIYFLYKKWISVEKLTFISNFSKKLQIINFFESRLIDFDTVIIPFMNEGFYPDNKNIFYKIPFFLKKKFNIPIQKYIDADYAYHFYRLLQRSKNIYLLYNTEPDSIFTGEKSRFISQLEI